MPYRTRRERRYRRKLAKAAGPRPGTAGGWGLGAPISRADLLLLSKAVRERWDVPRATRQAVCDRLGELINSDDVRMQLSVANAAITLMGDNHRRLFEAIDRYERGQPPS